MTIPVFLNDRCLMVAPGTTAVEAVRQEDAALADAVAAGTANLTDGRGIALAPESPLGAGAILRAARSARRPVRDPDAAAAEDDDAEA
ncbi:MAG: hypothetical protein AB7S39_07960 [Gemmatimonadales bacterium]